jgi:hypothetical protein
MLMRGILEVLSGAAIIGIWWGITAFLAPRIFPRMDEGSALLIVFILLPIVLFLILKAIVG